MNNSAANGLNVDAANETNVGATSVTGCGDVQAVRDLVAFIRECPSMFHTAAAIRARLDAAGFAYLPESDAWDVRPGGCYYTVRNNSSVIAFKVGSQVEAGVRAGASEQANAPARLAPYRFQIAASHADSPTFKIKSVPELDGPGGYLRLNTEVYGGAIDYTWFDRPLGVAGRVMVRRGARVESRLFAPDCDVALVPSVAIHLNREVNASFSPKRNVDLCPLVSAGDLERGAFQRLVARELGVEPGQVLGFDLFLVNRQAPAVWGAAGEFVSSPKLDDLGCAFVSLQAFLVAENERSVNVFACFDNEEVGSNTKQGAMSTLLRDTLGRVNGALGRSDEDLRRAIAGSFLVSCDNAHAVHPNRPELYDEGNRAYLNHGIVIKEAANQKYCTDAFSRAVFSAICDDAGVPYQTFANRSDMVGGSTLGNLSNTQVSMHGVDVGLPQLAMHSSYETAGARDVASGIAALAAFYRTDLRIDGADAAVLG